MITRAAGAVAALASMFVAVSPALPWFGASTPSGDLTTTGFGSSGALWVLPLLGALGLAVGLAVAASRSPAGLIEERWAGGALVVLGAMACLWALWAALDPPVDVLVADGPADRRVALPVGVRPAAVLAPIAAAIVAGAGAAIALPWRARR